MPSRARIRAIVDGEDPVWGSRFAIAQQGLILVAAISYAVETLPNLTPAQSTLLNGVEVVVIAGFAAEYATRLAVAERPLRYALSFWGIIDLLAFLPSLLAPAWDLRSARLLRLVQLVRILKLLRLTRAMDRLMRALRDVRDELLITLFMAVVVLYLSAVGIHLFENEAQPENFASVFHSLWWALATLTTVGYGDVYPVTAGGRLFTALVLVVGLAVVAVPVGLISSALTRNEPQDNHTEETKT